MAVTQVDELFDQRGGKKDQEATEVRRMFRVLTDTQTDDALVVINDAPALGLPEVFDLHPASPDLWVDTVVPRPEADDGQMWRVVVTYVLVPPIPPGGGDKPWDLDPVINFTFMSRQRVFEKAYAYNQSISAAGATRDAPDVRVVNKSLNQPFDPPAMIEDALLMILIQRNIKQADFDPEDIRTYQNTICNDTPTIAGISFEQWTGWMRDIKADKLWTNENEPYWSVRWEIVYDPETWIKKIANMGVFEAGQNTSGTPSSPGNLVKYKKIRDEDGDAVRDPVPLNLQGQRIGQGDPTVYLPYHGLWEEDWAPIGLPSAY